MQQSSYSTNNTSPSYSAIKRTYPKYQPTQPTYPVRDFVNLVEIDVNRLTIKEQLVYTKTERIAEILRTSWDKKTFDIQETVYLLVMDRNQLIREHITINVGNFYECIVDIDAAIFYTKQCGGAGMIIAHNHPSGIPRPSKADINVTAELKDRCKENGLELIDHLIITKTQHFSFRWQATLQSKLN